MYKIYTIEAYHYDKDCWSIIGEFISSEDAKKTKDKLTTQYPERMFNIIPRDIIGTYEDFLRSQTS